MFHHWFLCLLCFFLLFVFVDVRSLNDYAKKINQNVQEKVDYFTAPSTEQSQQTQSSLKSSNLGLADLTAANETLKDMNQTYKESKEKVIETKATIKEGVREVKDTARSMARGLPRSEKEANQMLIAFGEKYFGNWKASFQRFGQRLRQSRQGAGSVSGSVIANKSGKVNASRQR